MSPGDGRSHAIRGRAGGDIVCKCLLLYAPTSSTVFLAGRGKGIKLLLWAESLEAADRGWAYWLGLYKQ